MKKIYLLLILTNTIALNAMNNKQILLEEKNLIKDIEKQIETPVSFSQLKKSIKNNNVQLATNLLQKVQSQNNAQEITQRLKTMCNLKKQSSGGYLLGTIAGYGSGALLIGLGIWFATKISWTNYYDLGVVFCLIGAFTTIVFGSYAHGEYCFIKHHHSFIDFAQRYPETIKAIKIELKKIDLVNKRKEIEKSEKELKELITQ